MDATQKKEDDNGEKIGLSRIAHTLVDLASEENKLTANLVDLAEKRNADSALRTDLVRQSAEYSRKTVELAEQRNALSKDRTDLVRESTGNVHVRAVHDTWHGNGREVGQAARRSPRRCFDDDRALRIDFAKDRRDIRLPAPPQVASDFAQFFVNRFLP